MQASHIKEGGINAMQKCTHVMYEDCREKNGVIGQPGLVEVRGHYCSNRDVLVVVKQHFGVSEGFLSGSRCFFGRAETSRSLYLGLVSNTQTPAVPPNSRAITPRYITPANHSVSP